MNLIKSSILTILVTGLFLASMPLPVIGPYEPVASPPASVKSDVDRTPQRGADSSPTAPPENHPVIPPGATQTAATRETAATSLPTLYPELEQIVVLKDLPTSEALVTLQELTHDADPVIRLAALAAIGGEVAIGYLLQARYDSHSKIHANADAILQEMSVAGIY